MYAEIAAENINAYCKLKFEDRGSAMASTMANGCVIDAYDHVGGGTHKYIPTKRLNEELGMPDGAGVFSYWKMKDGSYLLRTCRGPLAWWTGKDEDKAVWGDFA